MKECYDEISGALLFKSEPEDPLEKKIILLENSMKDLNIKINDLMSTVNELKEYLGIK